MVGEEKNLMHVHVEVIGKDKVVFSGFAGKVFLPGYEGQIEILPGHVHLSSVLKAGSIRIEDIDKGDIEKKTTEAVKIFFVSYGFFSIQNDKLKLLCDIVEKPEEINEKRVLKAEEKSLEALKDILNQSKKDIEKYQRKLARALQRKEVVKNITR